jgi:Sugar phosphate permease
MQTRSNGIFYGWVVVGITILMLLVGAGVRSMPGVFLLPIEQETAWSRSAITMAASVGLLLYGFSGPFAGWLLVRMNLRWLSVLGLLMTALSLVPSIFLQAAWQLTVLWGFFGGVGTGMVGSVLSAAVAARWFEERRGLVVGMFGASMSAGQLIFVPLLVWLGEVVGWRYGSLVLGLITLAIIVPTAIWLRDNPAEIGLQPYGAKSDAASIAKNAAPAEPAGVVMSRAVRSSDFWLLTITFFICGATSNGLIGTHLIAHATEHGIAPSMAATSMVLMGSMNFVGTIISGWLTDKYDPRKLLCIYYGFRGISLLFLPFVHSPLGLAFFAILFGLDYIATVPPTTLLIARIFGSKNVGTVYGWVFCAHQMGAALAAFLGGVAREQLGDYGVAFLVAGVIALAAALLAVNIRRPQQAPALTAEQA